jgi:hypothetical protein
MSSPPRHPRDFGGKFSLKNPDDGTPIIDSAVVGDRLLWITEKCTYAVRMADQIDPGRTNTTLPHNFQQKLFDHGGNSELLCRSFIQAKVLFRKEFQKIDIARAMQLSLDITGELIGMDEAAASFRAAEAAAIDKATRLDASDGSFALPAIGNVRTYCKTFAQRADHAAGFLLDVVRLFYAEMKKSNWNDFRELVKARHGEADNFYKVLELTVPFLQMIRNVRDCLDHRNLTGVTTSDFAMRADGLIDPPLIGVDFRGSVVEPHAISTFMTESVKSLLDTVEMISMHMCAKNMEPFAGMPMVIGPLSEDFRRAWRVRFAYGAYYEDGKFAPCG